MLKEILSKVGKTAADLGWTYCEPDWLSKSGVRFQWRKRTEIPAEVGVNLVFGDLITVKVPVSIVEHDGNVIAYASVIGNYSASCSLDERELEDVIVRGEYPLNFEFAVKSAYDRYQKIFGSVA